MTWQGERLVKVRSQRELHPGMFLLADTSEGKWSFFLVSRESTPTRCECLKRHGGWRVIGLRMSRVCLNSFAEAIKLGRLYRLRDEQKTDEKTRTREVEHSR